MARKKASVSSASLTPHKATSPERLLALWDLLNRHTSGEVGEGVTLTAHSWDEDDPSAPENILSLLERDYGLLISEDQYESDHAHANALQRLRCDLVTLNKLFARRDSLAHPDAEPHRTVTTTSQGQNCYTYHVERPFSAEEAFIGRCVGPLAPGGLPRKRAASGEGEVSPLPRRPSPYSSLHYL